MIDCTKQKDCGLCRFACCLWFTRPFISLVTADQARDPRQDSQQRCLCNVTTDSHQ